MDLNRLVEFNMIAELGSFTKAAEQLGVSTAVLSARFSKFEDQIGQKLFERSSRCVELTDAGQRFIADSREIVSDYFQAVRMGQNAAIDYRLNLKIAVAGFGIPSRLYGIIMQLNAKHLNLHVSLGEDPTWADLLEGRIQLYIGCGDEPNNRRIEKRHFGHLKQFLVLPRNHHLALQSEVTFSDLTGERLILYPETRLPGIRQQQLKMLTDANLGGAIVNDSISKGFYYDYIAMGMGVALLPFFNYSTPLPPSLTMVPLEPPNTKLNAFLYYLNDVYNPVLESIIHKLERQRASLEDYGWVDSDDN